MIKMILNKFGLDKAVATVASLGVPGLVLVIVIHATKLAGAAAITAALAAIGPGGMIGGIATLGVAVVIINALTKWGFDALYSGVVKELYKRGETKESIRKTIEGYPISKDLKRKLLEIIDTMPVQS